MDVRPEEIENGLELGLHASPQDTGVFHNEFMEERAFESVLDEEVHLGLQGGIWPAEEEHGATGD